MVEINMLKIKNNITITSSALRKFQDVIALSKGFFICAGNADNNNNTTTAIPCFFYYFSFLFSKFFGRKFKTSKFNKQNCIFYEIRDKFKYELLLEIIYL